MAQMHTLIINGQAYTLVDAAAARIDDSAVGDNTWSSGQIVNRLCPSFTQRGSEVVCTPVVGHPLKVVSHIEPIQAGTGDPTPENVRPISGFEQGKVTISNEEESNEFTINLGQTVYGGDLDWNTGLLTITQKGVAMKDLSWADEAGKYFWVLLSDGKHMDYVGQPCICSIFARAGTGHDVDNIRNGTLSKIIVGSRSSAKCYAMVGNPDGMTLADFTALIAQKDAFLVYTLAEPYTVQLTPQQILALAGTNRIYSNTGDTDVRGKADPDAVIQDLSGKLNALSATMTALTGV